VATEPVSEDELLGLLGPLVDLLLTWSYEGTMRCESIVREVATRYGHTWRPASWPTRRWSRSASAPCRSPASRPGGRVRRRDPVRLRDAHPPLRKHPRALTARLKALADDNVHNYTRATSRTGTSPGDLSGLPCDIGFCHLSGPRISDFDAYGAGLVNVAHP
jgi:hypothetical protein